MREELYQTLGAIASQIAGFYQMAAMLPAWAAALVGDLPIMPNQHLRLLTRHVITPLVKACPPAHRSVPSSAILLSHMISVDSLMYMSSSIKVLH